MTDFQLVKSRKNKKKKQICIINNDSQQFEHNDTISIEKIDSKLNEAMSTMKISDFYSSMRDLMSEISVENVVCYGIGNFADCFIARYQLALLMLLREDILKIDKHDCYFYDPKLYMAEKEFLTNSGFTVIMENEEGKRRTEKNTLFYMPHCGKSLYNNLLWANWNVQNLSHCVVIGNSFNNIVDITTPYMDSWDFNEILTEGSIPYGDVHEVKSFKCDKFKERNPRRKLEESCWYLLNISPHVKEEKFPENFQYTDIFNDTVKISFPEVNLQEVTSQTWQHIDEPVYNDEDQEFISNKSSL